MLLELGVRAAIHLLQCLYTELQQSCFHFSPLLDWELSDPTTVPRHLGMVSLQNHVTLLFRLLSKELPSKGRDSSPLKAQKCQRGNGSKSKHLQVLPLPVTPHLQLLCPPFRGLVMLGKSHPGSRPSSSSPLPGAGNGTPWDSSPPAELLPWLMSSRLWGLSY